jgi:phosphoglucosamine mutase
MNRLFGTDGVRGVANAELTPELAFNLGKAGAYILSKDQQNPNPKVVIGKDTRISGDMLEHALSAGIMAMGGEVIHVGVLPTPAIACLVRTMGADAGVMISASHNPFEYNGIKFFNRDGFKLDDDIEDAIEDIIVRDIDVNSHITGARLGRCIKEEHEAQQIYIDHLKETFDGSLSGYKIVLDCANGAAFPVAPLVYRELGAEVILIGDQPDGTNINANCGSTHPALLQETVLREKADIGLAFDGDADRLIGVDEKGRLIDGDKLLCICANMMKQQDQLPNNLVTATVMSNVGFLNYIRSIGCDIEITSVGDRYVLESMQQSGCMLGGEQSGHIIFLNHSTTGDGTLSSLQVMKAIRLSGKKPSELADEITIYPQILVNALVKSENKNKYLKDQEIVIEIKAIEEKMNGNGRVLIRPSGTEPLVRVMLEGEDMEQMTLMANNLATLITFKLG